MMEIIKSVFTRNSEFLQGTHPRAEKARKLMVQIVNAMTVKQEIGSPMACAHLLGHPDHYTNYKFRPFYWRMFVGGNLVALSPVVDYELRPDALHSMSLYDWIRLTEKQKIPKQRKKPAERELTDDKNYEDDDLLKASAPRVTRGTLSQKTLVNEEADSGYSSDETLIAEDEGDADYEFERDRRAKKGKRRRATTFEFADAHPQHKTHRVRVLTKDQAKIPNFVGGILPRKDKGDVEEYCRAMLTLFKPWSDPKSLKDPEQTWEAAFQKYQFTNRQRKTMGFFHVRYECNDARDDFRSQR
ncbi:hypothetical protein PENSPDRAFT_554242, partial [Peniophora sp. CONT]